MEHIASAKSIGEFVLRVGASGLVPILLIVLAPPSAQGQMGYGSAIYSGSSVGSSWTIYGWGVTDVQNSGCYCHWGTVSTTIRSPNGRTYTTSAGGSGSAWSRADVWLTFVENDLGGYRVTSTHRAYCPYCHCYFINGSTTEVWDYISIKTTYGKNTRGYRDAGTTRYCGMTPDCSNGVTPACGASSWLHLITTSSPCPEYIRATWLAWRTSLSQPFNCLPGGAFVATGPGPCDP